MPWIKDGDDWSYQTEDPHLQKLQEQIGSPITEYERASAWKAERVNIQRWKTLFMYRSAVAVRKFYDRISDFGKGLS